MRSLAGPDPIHHCSFTGQFVVIHSISLVSMYTCNNVTQPFIRRLINHQPIKCKYISPFVLVVVFLCRRCLWNPITDAVTLLYSVLGYHYFLHCNSEDHSLCPCGLFDPFPPLTAFIYCTIFYLTIDPPLHYCSGVQREVIKKAIRTAFEMISDLWITTKEIISPSSVNNRRGLTLVHHDRNNCQR